MDEKPLEFEAQQLSALEKALPNMTLDTIAQYIAKDWKKPYFGARPYLEAMFSLQHIGDRFGYDDGREIVLYFLANAQTWRGARAKLIKKELKGRCK